MPSPLPDLSCFKPDDETVDNVERMLERGAGLAELQADLYAAAIASGLLGVHVDPLTLSRIWLGWALCELHAKGSCERAVESPMGRMIARELTRPRDEGTGLDAPETRRGSGEVGVEREALLERAKRDGLV